MAARTFGLIPAAGSGSRLGSAAPKQYLSLAGKPMLHHAIAGLLGDRRVEMVFVVLAPDDTAFRDRDWSAFGERVAPLWCGGASRRDSVLNGLIAAASAVEPNDWILVHDAARPCLGKVELARLIDTASDDEVGGILAVPVADTLKRAGEDRRILATEPRDGLWQAQTPQMFRHGLLLRALRAAPRVTDESAAVEGLGHKPLVVEGSARNLKVTFPSDLALAERFLGGGMSFRVGQGFDSHALVAGRKLILGGVEIPHAKGLAGHSDADALIHALCDALLGAAALGDIGRHFPDTDPKWKGADSRALLRAVARKVREAGYDIANVDATVIAETPKLAPHIPAMVANIAADLGLGAREVNVKAKTAEKLGALGRGEGIAAQAVALLVPR